MCVCVCVSVSVCVRVCVCVCLEERLQSTLIEASKHQERARIGTLLRHLCVCVQTVTLELHA